MKYWFTADTHFGHAKIIQHCNRPFANVEEMDEAMIARWNSVVQPNDGVFHLGDFAWGSRPQMESYLSRLNGRISLVFGNHDASSVRNHTGWWIKGAMVDMMIDGHYVVMCHYPMRVWDGSHRGSLHLFGHVHGALPGDSQSCDVGVDAWNFQPVSLEDILQRMAHQPKHLDVG